MESLEILAIKSELTWLEDHKESNAYSDDFIRGVKQALYTIQQVQELPKTFFKETRC